MRGADGNTARAADDGAGVRAETAGDVDGQDRAAQRVDVVDAGAQLAAERPCLANAEQAVNHQRPALPGQMRGVGDVKKLHFGFARALQRLAGIFGLLAFVGVQGDRDTQFKLGQIVGGFQRIAAVVAGAGQDQHMNVVVAGHEAQGFAGTGFAGALHQRVGRQFCLGGMFDLANLGNRIKRTHRRRGPIRWKMKRSEDKTRMVLAGPF